jgi:murein endopeptidase
VRNDRKTMPRSGVRASATVVGIATALAAGPALANRSHFIERGETLEHIARQYDCSVEEIQRANHIDTTLIIAGKTLKIPACKADDRVAAVDAGDKPVRRSETKKVAVTVVEGQSVGEPWDGELHDGVRLHLGDGFKIRRPKRAWGASHAVAQVERALGSIHAKFPSAHTLAIGDMSQRDGGQISDHHSHQSGRDIDIGLYFTKVPDDYPDSFHRYNDDLDLKKTWYLLQAFAKTADDDTGVQKIYMDFSLQGKLYKWALDHDVPRGYLDDLFQFPHGRGAREGLVRHEPNHDDHFHVRFKCPPDDDECES